MSERYVVLPAVPGWWLVSHDEEADGCRRAPFREAVWGAAYGRPTYHPEAVRMLKYLTLGEAFGWTPQEVDESPARLVDDLLLALQARAEVAVQRGQEHGR